jgi:hypothetical protein
MRGEGSVDATNHLGIDYCFWVTASATDSTTFLQTAMTEAHSGHGVHGARPNWSCCGLTSWMCYPNARLITHTHLQHGRQTVQAKGARWHERSSQAGHCRGSSTPLAQPGHHQWQGELEDMADKGTAQHLT